MSFKTNNELNIDTKKYCIVISRKGRGVYENYKVAKQHIDEHNIKSWSYKFVDTFEIGNEIIQNIIDKEHSSKAVPNIKSLDYLEQKKIKYGFCRKCGRPIDDNDGYCRTCNESVVIQKNKIQNKKRRLLDNLKKIKDKKEKQKELNRINQIHKNAMSEFDFKHRYIPPKNLIFNKEGKYIPLYLKNIFDKDKTLKLIYIDGYARDPLLHYFCKKCECEYDVLYSVYKESSSHNCIGKSSYETLIKEYLEEKGIEYLREYETLSCINPTTNKILPYDFEIKNKKIIIEAHGDQHREFNKHYHKNDVENFEKQKMHDKHKKEYAINLGYLFLELWSEDFKTNQYKQKINNIIAKRCEKSI